MRSPSRRPVAPALLLASFVAAAFATPALATGPSSSGAHHGMVVERAATPSSPGAGTPAEDRGRGLVYAGLAKHTAACPHALEVVGVDVPTCSDGPDDAPAGVNV